MMSPSPNSALKKMSPPIALSGDFPQATNAWREIIKVMFFYYISITSWSLDNRFWVLQIVPIPNVSIFRATTADGLQIKDFFRC